MFDRITQLIFACICLAVTFGAMNITLATEYEDYSNASEYKCEVAAAWIERWTTSDVTPRYIDVEMRYAGPDWFDTCRGDICNPDLSEFRYALPQHECGLETTGVVDTQQPSGYVNRNEMIEGEELLNLGVHFVDVSHDGRSANLFVSRYVVPSEHPNNYCFIGTRIVSALKTENGWSFYE